MNDNPRPPEVPSPPVPEEPPPQTEEKASVPPLETPEQRATSEAEAAARVAKQYPKGEQPSALR